MKKPAIADGALIRKKHWFSIAGIVGIVLFSYGLVSAIFYSNIKWYSYFVVGGTLFIGYINFKSGNESILTEGYKNIIKIYIIYIIAAIVIEIIGNYLFNLWYYPSFDLTDKIIHIFLVGYPFAFFFIYEYFILIKKYVQSFSLALVSTTLINALLHEIPNTFAWEWIYTIPYITFEILQINIIVIIGWIILILTAITTRKF